MQKQKRQRRTISEDCLFYFSVPMFTLFKTLQCENWPDQSSLHPQNSGIEVLVVFAREGRASSLTI